jgi:hypothetical protein
VKLTACCIVALLVVSVTLAPANASTSETKALEKKEAPAAQTKVKSAVTSPDVATPPPTCPVDGAASNDLGVGTLEDVYSGSGKVAASAVASNPEVVWKEKGSSK